MPLGWKIVSVDGHRVANTIEVVRLLNASATGDAVLFAMQPGQHEPEPEPEPEPEIKPATSSLVSESATARSTLDLVPEDVRLKHGRLRVLSSIRGIGGHQQNKNDTDTTVQAAASATVGTTTAVKPDPQVQTPDAPMMDPIRAAFFKFDADVRASRSDSLQEVTMLTWCSFVQGNGVLDEEELHKAMEECGYLRGFRAEWRATQLSELVHAGKSGLQQQQEKLLAFYKR
eukprot:SAG25_NODE_2760_length_1398_cov_1.055427_2_plen_230_part_00